MAKQEREYQTKCIEAVFKDLDSGINKVIVALATGAGKTFVAAKIANRFKRILFLCHTEELIEQGGIAMLNEFYPEISIADMIEQHGGLIPYFRYLEDNKLFVSPEDANRFGIIKANLFKTTGHITIASLQTIHRRLDRISPDCFDLVVIDECHMASANTFKKTLDYFKPKLLVGLSATPYRADGASLADIFDKISFQFGIADGIQEGYLCELDAIQVKTQINLDNVRTTAGEFNQKDLTQEVDTPERNKLIVDSYKKYADGKQNLVFCVDVQHAQNLCQTFKDAGYLAEFIVGDVELTPDRRDVINRFKSGETTVLVNVAVLIAGFDHPGIGCLTMAAPTKSLTRYIQQIGRSTRTLPGVIDGIDNPIMRRDAIKRSKKPACIILDVVDTSNRHKIISTWSLDREKPIKDRVFTTQEKKNVLIEAKKKREFEAQTKEDKRVNLLEIPKTKLGKGEWTKDPATGPQLDKLRALGFDVENQSYSKGDANRMIDGDPAPMNWVYAAKKMGYDLSNGLTRGEFVLIMSENEKKKQKEKEKKDLGNNVIIDGL